MAEKEFRRRVKGAYPHIRVYIKTVSFVDLAGASKKCLTIANDMAISEVQQINQWAEEAGIVPDGNVRCYAA